jgi:hypothetical protein
VGISELLEQSVDRQIVQLGGIDVIDKPIGNGPQNILEDLLLQVDVALPALLEQPTPADDRDETHGGRHPE